MEKIKIYYPYIDDLKGFAILLMVMVHVIAWSYPNPDFLSHRLFDLPTNEFNASFLWKVIYSFHMPLLFVLSGFLFFKPIQYDWATTKRILWKRVTRLLIPYLVTGCFVLYLKGYFGYWFLQILFVVNVITVLEYHILYRIKANFKVELVSHAVIFILLLIFCKSIGRYSIPMEFSNIVGLYGYYLAFIVGVLLKKYSKFFSLISNKWFSFVCILFYILLFFLSNINYNLSLVRLLIPLTASFYLIYVFQNFDYRCTNVVGWLSIIGKNSLEVYILHLFFVMPFKEIGSYILQQDNFAFSLTLQIVYSLIISIFAISLSIIVSRFFKKNIILSKLLFGI